jgi:hypothetical protein
VLEERKLLVYRCKYLTRQEDLCKRNHCCSGKAVSIIYSECVFVCVCVCSLQCPVRNVNAPCFYLWPVQLYCIFPHYLIKAWFKKKKGSWTWRVSWFLPQILSEAFLTLWRIKRDMINGVYWFLYKYLFFLSDLIKLEFSRQILEKYSSI